MTGNTCSKSRRHVSFFLAHITGSQLVDPVDWIDSQCGKHMVGHDQKRPEEL